ncbi:MAG: hypothetical protein RR929_01885 [Erysipelotrichaceae bacterium]
MKFKAQLLVIKRNRCIYTITNTYLFRSYRDIFNDVKDLKALYKNTDIKVVVMDQRNKLLYKSLCNDDNDKDKMINQLEFYKRATIQYNRMLSSC